jgi:hypothetical protein
MQADAVGYRYLKPEARVGPKGFNRIQVTRAADGFHVTLLEKDACTREIRRLQALVGRRVVSRSDDRRDTLVRVVLLLLFMNTLPDPDLKTARLRLRILRPGDEVFLAALDSDPVVMQHVYDGAVDYDEALEAARCEIELSSTNAPNASQACGWLNCART